MAPKSKKAAGAGRRAGAKYKDDRVPGPAVMTEEYAAVSLYHCSTVGAISCSLFLNPCTHNNPVAHASSFLWLGFCFAKRSLRLFNDQLIR
jgi:hypothetical protein